jgi:hypothetical protein
MSVKSDDRLTPRQRLARGLTYSAIGPVDVTRGAVGLSTQSLAATADELRRRYRKSQLRRELAAAQETIARELAAAGEVVSGLPDAIQEARTARRPGRRRWLVVAGVGTVVLAGGAVAFSVIRRSSKPEPSTLPPSVHIDPKP